MIAAGCDIGSLTAKAVIKNESKILATQIMRVTSSPERSALEVMNSALEKAGLSMSDIDSCVGTGYGRRKIPFIKDVVSEISCHSKGAQSLVPQARTIIDIGGQDAKVISVDKDGRILKFLTNDKCAAGTGRFLEVMARLMELKLDDLGKISAMSRNPLPLTSTCNVWVQSEVIYHLNDNRPVEDIVAGINQAMAERVSIMVNRLGITKDVCMTGGVAKNKAVVTNMEKILGVRIRRFRTDPQLVGAIGAAEFARERRSVADDCCRV